MLKNYLKIAWKVLGRNKFFTFVSLFGISITIGIVLVLSALFDHLIGSHYPELKRERTLKIIFMEMTNAQRTSTWREYASFHFIDQYVKQMKTPAIVAMISGSNPVNIFVGDKKIALSMRYTCENIWKALDFDFLEGRPYAVQDIKNDEYVAVISKSARDNYFGEGQPAVGKNMVINNNSYRVIGVIRDVSKAMGFTQAEIYLPHNTNTADLRQKELFGFYYGLIQAKQKSDIPQIKAEYQALIDRLEKNLQEYLSPEAQKHDPPFVNLHSVAATDLETISSVLFRGESGSKGKFIAVLMIALFLFMMLPALNLINLNASRIQERFSEIGVRKAFGATSSTLAMQFVVENIVLTFLGGIIALLLAYGILQIIEAQGLIKYAELTINFRIFSFALLLCFIFGILSGILPALRMSKIKIVNALKGHNL